MYNFLGTFLFRTPSFSFFALPDFETKQHESVFREMLQIATSDLSEGMDKGTDKAQYSVYRYYQRACTRPTPFGLFAGCSIGNIGERTEIQMAEQGNYKRNTRLDMNYICALTQQIEKNRNIRGQLCYYPNNSLYSVGNYLRYMEYFYRKTRRIHQIAQVDNSEYLQRILTLAEVGARFTELTATIVDDEITTDEAIDFIHE
ncbi:MAG: lantibiotic dehydratase family protein, partial [Prevotella sp.]|nr:lantibiotic dehydratase family protein [Prevotella sp.]